MIEVFHAPRTRGYRVIWLCEELSLPYRIVPIDMSPTYRNSEEWRALSPTGKVPVMRDGEFTMYESCAMVQYLLAKHGSGRLEPAAGTAEHGRYLQWCWFSEATFARPLGEIVNHRRAFGDAAQQLIVDEMAGRARSCADAVEGALGDEGYLLGETFTAADIMLGYTLKIYQALMETPLPPKTNRYWERLLGRPAHAATIEAEKRAAA